MINLLDIKPYTSDRVAPSPNHGERKTSVIAGIILHATEDRGQEARTLAWMRSPRSRVSCHLFVARSGRVTRLVGDQQRAWHAGVARWRGTTDVNSITLGIEIANRNDGEPYTDAQYERVAEIVVHYCRQGLRIDDVVGHNVIAAGRKSDPNGWDWTRFRALVAQQLQPADVAAAGPRPATSASHSRAAFTKASEPSRRHPPVFTSAKPVVRSRTFWLNALTVFAAGGAIIGETLDLAFFVGLAVPQEITTWALFCVGVVNIVLRFSTTRPICMS